MLVITSKSLKRIIAVVSGNKINDRVQVFLDLTLLIFLHHCR